MNEGARSEKYIDKKSREITIAEMGDEYIFAGDLSGNTCTCIGPINPRSAVPDEVFLKYQKKVKERYGQSAILAFSTSGDVIGFITFHPINVSFDELCPGRNPEKAKREFDSIKWPDNADSKLRILCVSVAPEYRRCGVASQMMKALIKWAKELGYERLHVGANEKAWWIPAKPFYDKLGFEVVNSIEFDEPRPDGERRLFVMERNTGW